MPSLPQVNDQPRALRDPRPFDQTSLSTDYAKPDKGALDVHQLERWLQEVREQPQWRTQCDIDADYYDGHQLTGEILEKLRQKGFPAIKENLCRPTIDAVLGLEAKTRTDWVVKADHDQWEEVAQAMSVKMKEAERESQADRACSDSYAAQIKVGLGWVEVSREIVPFRYPYRVRYVHRREIAWDWRSKEPDLSDARYLVRRQWFDQDVVIAMFPKHEQLIRMVGNQWSGWWDDVIRSGNTGLAAAYDMERTSSIEDYEFRDYLRKRLCVYEIWYRVWKATTMLKLPDGRWIEYDKKNMQHVAAVAKGLLIPQILPVPKMRLSFWIGPHRLIDVPTPYAHHNFPYIPFWGYREDRSAAPYGLIRNMRDQQDEVNARKQKMMWLLSSKQVITDGDAVADHNKAMREVARADAYIILNEHRKPSSKFEVNQNLELSEQQFKIYENAKQSLQDVAGVYQAMLGKESNAESGVAINSLIEQGTITLAEINDNYRFARRKVGELLMELVREDIANGTTITVGEGMQRKEVTLNEEAEDDIGPHLRNDVKRAGVKLVLDDIPATPTFRTQQLAHLTEFTKGLPDEMKSIISDFIIEATDLPQRRQIGERIRQHLGIGQNQTPRTPEEAAELEAQKQEQARKADLVRRAEEADVALKEAQAVKTQREAETMGMDKAGAQDETLAKVQQEVQKVVEEAKAEVDALNQKIAMLETALKSRSEEARTKAESDNYRARVDAGAKIAVARMQQQRDDVIAGMNQKIEEAVRKVQEAAQAQIEQLAKKLEQKEREDEQREREREVAEKAKEKGAKEAKSESKEKGDSLEKAVAPVLDAVAKAVQATEALAKQIAEDSKARAQPKTVELKKADGSTMKVTVNPAGKGKENK